MLEIPVLPPPPAFTVLPAYANNINLRALAQPSKDIAARPQVQHAKNVVREDVSVIQTRDRVAQIAPQEQDWDAAGILVEVARKQHPISPAIDMGTISVKERRASKASASMGYSRKCLVTTCSYHLDIGPWSKKEKDKHALTHFEGNIQFGTDKCRYSLPWPNFIEAPQEYFNKIRSLKYSIETLPEWDLPVFSHDSRCLKCMIYFGDPSSYLEHLDDCIFYAVQVQALGMAQPCPVPICEHHPTRVPPRSSMDQYMIRPYLPSLGCGRCYTDQCQCPPVQQVEDRSLVKKC